MGYFRNLAKNESDVPPATGMLAGLALGVCVFGLWFTDALVTTRPIVILTIYSLPLALLGGGFAGIILGSRGALRFTRFFLGLFMASLAIPFAYVIVYGDYILPRLGAVTCTLYLASLYAGLRGNEDTILGPPATRTQLRRRIAAIVIVFVAFSAASWIWAERNGITLY